VSREIPLSPRQQGILDRVKREERIASSTLFCAHCTKSMAKGQVYLKTEWAAYCSERHLRLRISGSPATEEEANSRLLAHLEEELRDLSSPTARLFASFMMAAAFGGVFGAFWGEFVGDARPIVIRDVLGGFVAGAMWLWGNNDLRQKHEKKKTELAASISAMKRDLERLRTVRTS
jgi:hypothetical protein